MGGDEEREGAKEQEVREKAKRERGGGKQVRSTWLLPGNCGVEFRQNANMYHLLTLEYLGAVSEMYLFDKK